MRAARVHTWGSAPVLEDIAEPSPSAGESIVEVAAAAIGHFDLTVARGEVQPGPSLPYVPGTDGAGVVLAFDAHETGSQVRSGEEVWASDETGRGPNRSPFPMTPWEPIPDGVDPVLAACFSVPASAALTAVTHVRRLQPGERVAVTGAAGAVGSITVQLARRAGAAAVFAIVSSASKAASVPAGTTVVVGRGSEVINQLSADAGTIDLLVDTVGGPNLVDLLPAMSHGGRVVLVGYTAGRNVTLDLPALMDLDVSLLPLNLVRRPAQTREAAATVLGLLRDGDIELPMSRFPLEDVGAAVERLTRGETVGRVVLLPRR